MNKAYKAILSAAAAAIVAGVSIVPTSVLAWGDNSLRKDENGNFIGRQAYTIDEINNKVLGNKITFNSITDGKIGDERNFVGAKMGTPAPEQWADGVWNADEIKVKDGDILTIRMYVHNNSLTEVAEGVRAQFSLPVTVGKTNYITGYLNTTSTNVVDANRFWDEIKLVSDEDFYIEYVKGSAMYTNTNENKELRQFALDGDKLITSAGVLLGYNQMDGKIPGCYKYDGQVTIQVKIHSGLTSYLSKTVRMAGTHDEFTEAVDAKVGDEVEYQIEYRNLSKDVANDVMIRDILPTNMEYVADSTYLYTSEYQDGVLVKSNNLTTSGINIGSNYQPRANAYIRFRAKVVNKNLVCGTTQMVNWANVTVNGNVVKDDASVMVNVTENCRKNDDPKNDEPNANNSTIVSTGPAEFAGAAFGLGTVVTVAGYYVASKRKF